MMKRLREHREPTELRQGVSEAPDVLVVYFVLGLSSLIGVLAGGWPAWVVVAPMWGLLLFPGWLVRRWLLPGGWYRLGTLVAFTDLRGAHRDRVGMAMAVWVWGACRLQDPGPALARFRAVAGRRNVGPGVTLAWAWEAAWRGRTGDAESLLSLLPFFDVSVTPPRVRLWASGWLAGEAAERGDWSALRWRLGLPRVRLSRGARGLLRVAERIHGVPHDEGDLRGFGLPEALIAEALATQPVVIPAAAADPVVSAVETSAWALRVGRLSPDQLRTLGLRWAQALAEQPTLRPQALTLCTQLVARALRGPPGQPAGALMQAAVWAAVEEEVDALRALSEALAHRVRERQPLSMAEEVLAWCRVYRQVLRVVQVGGEAHLPTAFDVAYSPLVNHPVWLHNERGQRMLANAMYRAGLWLAERAHREGATELLERNVACGPANGHGWHRVGR